MVFSEHDIHNPFDPSFISHRTNPNRAAPRRNRSLPNRHTSCGRYLYKTPSNQPRSDQGGVSYPSHNA
ncbi:hypothetical protein GE21DRAFT_1311483 [Neurospora crassa]|nr:hypothetical protein GE21DRAFT_1311483 [Neurospora crassa]